MPSPPLDTPNVPQGCIPFMNPSQHPGAATSGHPGVRLPDLAGRPPMAPWAEGNTIPWDEPGFSARMLREHLSQAHDLASRRFELIDRHVRWLHETVAEGGRGRVLDLACGPGLYSSRLARLGHRCLGIDFSPAAIEHARAVAKDEGLPCRYRLADLRDGGFADETGAPFDLALLISGELDVFPPEDAASILAEVGRVLRPGGALVLEVHEPATVRSKEERPATWSAHESGLFSAKPHLLLQESAWFEEEQAAVERFYVVDLGSSRVERHEISTRATRLEEYAAWLGTAGLEAIEILGSLGGAEIGESEAEDADFRVLVARKCGT